MKAVLVRQHGAADVLQVGEAELPKPGKDEVLVRVLAAGTGPWDCTFRSGAWTGPFPYIPGGEFAGVVVGDTGEDAALDDGTPVYGFPRFPGLSGCYAEYVTCPVEQLAPIPQGLPVTSAAATPVDALTALQGLTDILDAGPGDQVLITAAAGGLGHFAVQIARALGASVVATASPRDHDFVHTLGASMVIDHTKDDWPGQVRDATGGGPDKVLACAAPTLEGSAEAAADGATIATPVRAGLPAAGQVTWRPYDGEPRGSRLIRLAPWFNDGTLSVHLQSMHYWQNAVQAHREVEQGNTRGKIVLVVDDDLAAGLEV
jgi:NADPH:quinone reductase-like Zn-dependent oxidoreductase